MPNGVLLLGFVARTLPCSNPHLQTTVSATSSQQTDPLATALNDSPPKAAAM